MATEAISSSMPLRTAHPGELHPLAPLSAEEITNAATIVKAQWPSNVDLQFKSITLREPAKADTVPYLEAEFYGHTLPKIDRRAFVTYYLRKTVSMSATPTQEPVTDGKSRTSFTRRLSTLPRTLSSTMCGWALISTLPLMARRSWPSSGLCSKMKVSSLRSPN